MYNTRRRKTVSVSDISCFLPSLSSRTYCRTLSSSLDVRTFCPLYSFDVPSIRSLNQVTNDWHKRLALNAHKGPGISCSLLADIINKNRGKLIQAIPMAH